MIDGMTVDVKSASPTWLRNLKEVTYEGVIHLEFFFHLFPVGFEAKMDPR